VKADPAAQRALLDLQAIDSEAQQLAHRRRTLPEVVELAGLEPDRRVVDDRRRDQQIVVDDLTVAQRKAEADADQVRARRTRDQDRMEQGLITSPKDLERMQGELVSLDRRIGVLEEEELEVMEQLEAAEAALATTVSEIEAIDIRSADLVAARDEKTVGIDAQLADLEAARGPALEGLPADLLALYEKLRAAKGGVGAAELRQRRCGGCHLGIDNAALQVIASAPADLVVRCEECQRILVRTAESGL